MSAGLVVAAATGASAMVQGDAPELISAPSTDSVADAAAHAADVLGTTNPLGVVGVDGALDVLEGYGLDEAPVGVDGVMVPEEVATVGDVVEIERDGSFNALNNVCVAPWYWEGPGNVGSTANVTDYAACNGDVELGGDGSVNILNNVCVAPWHWDGPLNLFNTGNFTTYAACN
ncbi:hypothetical protein ACFQBY_01530 [Promicromonospora citrea]|uniref:Uncharacterized protein n=1 Tax=Promicromonospora citrea TaxID=43677 RepID=A0A8H9GP75_9MICO|nr:hypothetical protein [Promicromonospora citrea]NNH53553.1 hypothetical protein [Promicromonospora citrea]GGM39357.1 hypothetical protein GCM10010102_38750 [Promicromonospora citrea]